MRGVQRHAARLGIRAALIAALVVGLVLSTAHAAGAATVPASTQAGNRPAHTPGAGQAESGRGPRATGPHSCRRFALTPRQAIDCLWPAGSRAKAHRVAECESTASAPPAVARRRGLGRWAVNGRYVGIFQMGTAERRAHGWYDRGAPARVQVASALSLYRDRGWQPWACA